MTSQEFHARVHQTAREAQGQAQEAPVGCRVSFWVVDPETGSTAGGFAQSEPWGASARVTSMHVHEAE
jgi:hypothetical protein